MKFSEINPSSALKTLLVAAGVTETVYADGERPTSKLPAKFVEISNNGYTSTPCSQFGYYEQTLLVSVSVKLTPMGTKDSVSEAALMAKFDDIFKGTPINGKYSFSVSKASLFGGSKNLIAGYSTKLMNIVSTIQN